MSEVMLHGVLNMPIDIWGDDDFDKIQRHSRYVEASELIQSQAEEVGRLTKANQHLEDVYECAVKEIAAIKAENKDFREEVIRRNRSIKNLQQCALADIAEYESLKADVEKLEEALSKIEQWCEAYPVDIFPEPDFKKVHKALKESGLSLDQVSASNIRHVVNGISAIINNTTEDQ